MPDTKETKETKDTAKDTTKETKETKEKNEKNENEKFWIHKNDTYVLTTHVPPTTSPLNIYKPNPPKFDLVDDLSHLSHLNEPSVLHVLKNRYEIDRVYTYSGLFLLAVNPYKKLRIYDKKTHAVYAQERKSDTPPHIYAVAGDAYRQMLANGEDQSILITGESGAGKTENTKYAIEFLTANSNNSSCFDIGLSSNGCLSSNGFSNGFDSSNSNSNNNTIINTTNYTNNQTKTTTNNIANQVLNTNTILESFGNALTVKNNNSSRFGKFISIGFENGKIKGCRIEKYLLEKSRVTNTSANERNYHVFYEIFSDPHLCDELGLSRDLHDYRILSTSGMSSGSSSGGSSGGSTSSGTSSGRTTTSSNTTNSKTSTTTTNSNRYRELLKSFEILQIDPMPYFRVLAAILKLSNLEFSELPSGEVVLNERDTDQNIQTQKTTDQNTNQTTPNPKTQTTPNQNQTTNQTQNTQKTQKIDNFILGLNKNEFLNTLINPLIKAGDEVVRSLRSTAQCKAVVDGLCRILYDTLFDTLISALNERLYCRATNFIGILDIAGFEIFETNSFEQLCINYTNEKLQQFFNHHVFVTEQQVYRDEKLEWDYVDFGLDLQPTIDLIEKNNPVGILGFLDEQCFVLNGSNEALVNNLKTIDNTRFRFDKVRHKFILSHYAGEVAYDTREWIVKNKDPFFETLISLLRNSSDPFIECMFKSKSGFGNGKSSDGKSSSGKRDSSKSSKNNESTESTEFNSNTYRGYFRTVSQVYKNQLSSLMERLSATNPHFVRCILPNNKKQPGLFVDKNVLGQLRCNGVMEGIRISRMGYPNRILYREFVKRYNVITEFCRINKNGSNFKLNSIDCRDKNIDSRDKNIDSRDKSNDSDKNNNKSNNNLTPNLTTPNLTTPNNKNNTTTQFLSVNILNKIGLNKNLYRLGKTKLFFKTEVLADIEEVREQRVRLVRAEACRLVAFSACLEKKRETERRLRALGEIQANAELAVQFLRWGWMKLHRRLKPLHEMNRREELIRAKDREIAALQQLTETQGSDLLVKGREITSLLLLTETQGRELGALENQRAKAEVEYARLKAKNEETVRLYEQSNQALLKTKSGEIEALKKKIEALKNEASDAEIERNQLEIECRNLKNAVEREQQDAQSCRSKIAYLEQNIANLESSSFVRSEEENKLAELETLYKKTNTVLKKEKMLNKSLTEDLGRLKKNYDELMRSSIEEMTKRDDFHVNERSVLVKKIKSLEMQIRTMSEESEESGIEKIMVELEHEKLKRSELERELSEIKISSEFSNGGMSRNMNRFGGLNDKDGNRLDGDGFGDLNDKYNQDCVRDEKNNFAVMKNKIADMKRKLGEFYSGTIELLKSRMEKGRKTDFENELLRAEIGVLQGGLPEAVTVLQCDEQFGELKKIEKELRMENDGLKARQRVLVDENRWKDGEIAKILEKIEKTETELVEKNKLVAELERKCRNSVNSEKLRIYENEREKYKKLLFELGDVKSVESVDVVTSLNENNRVLGECVAGLKNEIKDLKIMCVSGEVRLNEWRMKCGEMESLLELYKKIVRK